MSDHQRDYHPSTAYGDAPTTVLPAYTDEERDHDGPDSATASDDDGGLAAELKAAAPQRWWNKATIYLAAVALLVAGFIGGIHVQQQWGSSSDTATGLPAGGSMPNFGGGNPPNFGGGSGNNAGTGRSGTETADSGTTTGTVKLINGNTVYVQTANGDVVVVRLSGKTSVQVARAGNAKELKAGDPVTVLGESGSDGSVTANSVTKQPK